MPLLDSSLLGRHGECPTPENTETFIRICEQFRSKNPTEFIGMYINLLCDYFPSVLIVFPCNILTLHLPLSIVVAHKHLMI